MADLLGVAGKVGAMTGVRALVDSAKLYNSVGSVVDTISISTPTSDFAIDANGLFILRYSSFICLIGIFCKIPRFYF